MDATTYYGYEIAQYAQQAQLPTVPSYEDIESVIDQHSTELVGDQDPHRLVLAVKVVCNAVICDINLWFRDPAKYKPIELGNGTIFHPGITALAARVLTELYGQLVSILSTPAITEDGVMLYHLRSKWDYPDYAPQVTKQDYQDMLSDSLLEHLVLDSALGNDDVGQLITEKGCDPNYRGPYGRTAVFFVQKDNQHMASWLAHNGASLTVLDRPVPGTKLSQRPLDVLFSKWFNDTDLSNWGFLEQMRRKQEIVDNIARCTRLKAVAETASFTPRSSK